LIGLAFGLTFDMRYTSTLLALAAAFSVTFAAVPSRDTFNGDTILQRDAPEVVADSYIVVFKKGANATDILDHEAVVEGLMSRKRSYSGKQGDGHHHHRMKHKYGFKNFNAYHLETDAETIAEIEASPEVAYVERNAVIHVSGRVSQRGSTYGLSRISHRARGASNYVFDNSSCVGITAYVIDSGIYLEHTVRLPISN
jgi:oryzin